MKKRFTFGNKSRYTLFFADDLGTWILHRTSGIVLDEYDTFEDAAKSIVAMFDQFPPESPEDNIIFKAATDALK